MLTTGAWGPGWAGVGLAVLRPVPMSAQWDSLDAAAAGLKSSASSTDAEVQSLSGFWQGLRVAYSQPETQEIVWSALDEVPMVTSEWSRVVGRAADVLQSFAVQGQSLEQQAQALHAQADHLAAQVAWTDLSTAENGDALRKRVGDHNDAVTRLNQAWQQLEEDVAADLDSLAAGGGQADEIPEVTADAGAAGGSAMVAAGFTQGSGFGFGLGSGYGHGWFGAGAGMPGQGGFLLDGLAAMVAAATANRSSDKVRQAADLYDDAVADGASGEDLHNFYDHLAEMDAEEIEEFSEERPQVNQFSMPLPADEEQLSTWPTGADGAQWWETMGDNGTQDAMLAFLPLLTGNTEGVNYTKRDAANRNALDRLRASEDLAPNQRERLDAIEDSLDGGDDRMLLSLNMGQQPTSEDESWLLDPPADPLAAVSVGNPDAADSTSFDIAGMGSGTHAMSSEVNNAQKLHNGLTSNSSEEHAVVSWIGYESPGFPDVLGEAKAVSGSWALAYALDGYRETMDAYRGDDETTVNVNAHSYGTNVAAYALTQTKYDVDTYTMYGSAGIDEDAAEHTSDLNVAHTDEGRPAVYATDSDQDSYSGLGRFGSRRADPTDPEFGAYVFSSDGTGNPPGHAVNEHYQSIDDPDEYGYRDERSQAYEALFLINAGRGDEVDVMTETTVEYYEDLFDQHVETVEISRPDGVNTKVIEYRVSIGGETYVEESRDAAMNRLNDYESERVFNRAEQNDVQTEAADQYHQSLAEHHFDEHVTKEWVRSERFFGVIPEPVYLVDVGGMCYEADTRAEAVDLLAEHYAEHGTPDQGGA